MPKVIATIMLLLFWSSVFGEGITLKKSGELRPDNPFSVTLYGAALYASPGVHTTRANPGIGLSYNLSPVVYLEGNYFSRNRHGGDIRTVGIGIQGEVGRPFSHSLRLGVQIARMQYAIPIPETAQQLYGRRIVLSGTIPILTAAYGENEWSIVARYAAPPGTKELYLGIGYRF